MRALISVDCAWGFVWILVWNLNESDTADQLDAHIVKLNRNIFCPFVVAARTVVVPLFKKGGQRVCSNSGITPFSFPGKVYLRMLERESGCKLNLGFKRSNVVFRPGCGTLD